jgi:hypothetical protein
VKSARRVVSILIGVAIVASLSGAIVVATPPLLARRHVRDAVERARRGTGHERVRAAEELLSIAGPEPVLALLDLARDPARPPTFVGTLVLGRGAKLDLTSHYEDPPFVPLVQAVELLASEGGAPIVRLALERLVDSKNDDEAFLATYLLDELDHPAFPPEPEGFTKLSEVDLRVLDDGAQEVLDELRPAVTCELVFEPRPRAQLGEHAGDPNGRVGLMGRARPWRHVLRIAQQVEASVAFEDGKLILCEQPQNDLAPTSGGTMDNVVGLRLRFAHVGDDLFRALEPRGKLVLAPGVTFGRVPSILFGRRAKALRALAKLNGLVLVERPDGTLELRR